jgi:hypothetical protein
MMAPTLSLDQWLRLGFSKWPSRVGTAIISLFYLKMETDPVSETLCFLRNITQWTKSKNMILPSTALVFLLISVTL